MTVNINAANITSIRLADQANAPTGVANNFINLYADTNGDIATVKGGGGGIKITTSPATGNYTLAVDGTGTAARLNANNVFTGSNRFSNTISVGGVAPAASGAGVTFPASFSASSDVNTLDDYEEGTFTPAYSSSIGAFGSITYATQIGRYVKVGRIIHVLVYMATNALSVGTASGTMRINLPVPTANITGFSQGGTITFSINWGGDYPTDFLMLTENASHATLYYRDNADGGSITLNELDFSTTSNSNYIFALLTYMTD